MLKESSLGRVVNVSLMLPFFHSFSKLRITSPGKYKRCKSNPKKGKCVSNWKKLIQPTGSHHQMNLLSAIHTSVWDLTSVLEVKRYLHFIFFTFCSNAHFQEHFHQGHKDIYLYSSVSSNKGILSITWLSLIILRYKHVKQSRIIWKSSKEIRNKHNLQ